MLSDWPLDTSVGAFPLLLIDMGEFSTLSRVDGLGLHRKDSQPVKSVALCFLLQAAALTSCVGLSQ
ncbi:mCG148027 [Mus musculus]|jgi:hypothetical protein|nr:mCG148027 [Mus musculus]